ncbi:MAG: hypothetical protein AB1700_05515 [Bacillota bacterium]
MALLLQFVPAVILTLMEPGRKAYSIEVVLPPRRLGYPGVLSP